jgi:hypothetical protein
LVFKIAKNTHPNVDPRFSSGQSSLAGVGVEGHDFKRAFNTFKVATANKMPHGSAFGPASPVPVSRGYRPGQGSSLDNSVKDRPAGQPPEDLFPAAGDGIRYLPSDSFYSYTVSRDESQSPADFLDLSEELEGMMSTSYDDCFRHADDDDPVANNANCLQVRKTSFISGFKNGLNAKSTLDRNRFFQLALGGVQVGLNGLKIPSI